MKDHRFKKSKQGWSNKKNASTRFIADVAKLNTVEPDPKVIRRSERKIDLLSAVHQLIPVLFQDYSSSAPIYIGPNQTTWLSSIFYYVLIFSYIFAVLYISYCTWIAYLNSTNQFIDAEVSPQQRPRSQYIPVGIVLHMVQAASRSFTDLAVLWILSSAFEATQPTLRPSSS
ncbi:hypothetical protein EDD18DRAFT_1355825 [Armillaria luteobubalina]|uniref:Uncharacterized protein n=1 Tax=Armillaria luteobubalina TaxID=153913 RepID=A0AA39UL73_9AGAR|nr:hypothetical protein EDD18DRAFT_1355825 [Armillaria luteobubalina]